MDSGSRRFVLGDLTNSYGKRTLSSSMENLGGQHNIDFKKATIYTPETQAISQLENLSTRNTKISCMKENCETWEDGGDILLLSILNDQKKHEALVSRLGVLSSQSSASSYNSRCVGEMKKTSELPVSKYKVDCHDSDRAYGLDSKISFSATLDQHGPSQELSTELKEEMKGCKTENIDVLKPFNRTISPSISSAFLKNNEEFQPGDETETDEECLTQRPLEKSSSEGFSRFSQSNAEFNVQEDKLDEHMVFGVTLDATKCIGDIRCSCSFCQKAAYMWTDLHYQVARGRLSALKKSRKLAKDLERKCSTQDVWLTCDDVNRAKMMEHDLMRHWRSLFLHMESIFAREMSQLHSSVLRFKELRESCKKDLEMGSSIASSEET